MQLTYPLFLFGLLAIAIPVIIHLLQLRRPQRLLFTNTLFIQELALITNRQRKVRHLAVLMTRALAVVALVFVFCQPFISARQQDQLLSGADGIGVLVDNSFSMQQRNEAGQTLFSRVVDSAGDIGQSLAKGVRISLINGGNSSTNPANYQEKLSELKLNSESDLPKIYSRVASDKKIKSAYLFSDFQKNSFDEKGILALGPTSEIVLAPVVAEKSGNVYVDSVWVDDAFVRVKTNIGLHIRLRNGGGKVATGCAVKVFLGDRQVAAFRVTVQPGQVVASVVQVQVNDGSVALGRVATDDAPVTFDNNYYFTLQPAAAIRVLEIGTEPVARQLYGNEPLFRYSFAEPRRVDYNAMRQANLVLVREVEVIDAGLRSELQAVVERGGTVVVVPSAQAAGRESYQLLFKELGLGPVQWEAKTATAELREVAMPSAQESFFRDVFGAQQRAVTMPRVAPVLRWSRTGRDILRLRDGESYLADFASGAGRVYVFSAPFAPEYSDFVGHALFVPVLYRMAMLSYQNEQLPAYRLTQGSVALKLPAEAIADVGTAGGGDEAGFQLVKDSLNLIPAQRVLGQEVRLEVPAGMDTPGFYRVRRRGKVVTTLAFNHDKRESELAAYSAAELRELIGPNRPNIRVLEGRADGADLARFQAERMGQPLWRYFLALALVFLLAEALLLRFGARPVGGRAGKLAAS